MKKLAEQDYLRQLEAAVAAAERGTKGEILVCIEGASETYRDVDHGLAALAATVALFAIVFAPDIEVDHEFVLPLLALVYVVVFATARRVPLLRRIFTTRTRRIRAARRGARLAFFEENVAASSERCGVLLYFSLLEDDAEILPDVGLDGLVTRAQWEAVERRIRQGGRPLDEALIAAVGEIGSVLASAAPAVGGVEVERLPDHARVRL
ncbi:MAG: hypothetical protein ACAI25_11405 [Planctomycetota bacterium]